MPTSTPDSTGGGFSHAFKTGSATVTVAATIGSAATVATALVLCGVSRRNPNITAGHFGRIAHSAGMAGSASSVGFGAKFGIPFVESLLRPGSPPNTPPLAENTPPSSPALTANVTPASVDSSDQTPPKFGNPPASKAYGFGWLVAEFGKKPPTTLSSDNTSIPDGYYPCANDIEAEELARKAREKGLHAVVVHSGPISR